MEYNTKYKRGDSVLIINKDSVKRVVISAVIVKDTGITEYQYSFIHPGPADKIVYPVHITYEFRIPHPTMSGYTTETYHEDDVFEIIEDLIAKFKTIEE